MGRITTIGVIFFAVALYAGLTPADPPAKGAANPKTYTVSCKLSRHDPYHESADKLVVGTIEVVAPDLTALEGTRAEYRTSVGKMNATPYGFRLRVRVTPTAGDKVRVEILAEDGWPDPQSIEWILTNRQRVSRTATLGKSFRLDLSKKKTREVWVELTVREAEEG
jgi:hypothetical protein